MSQGNSAPPPAVIEDPVEAARAKSVEQGLRDAGQPTEELIQEDYFGFEITHRVMLPDGVSFIEHRELNEGQRRKYLNETNKAVRIQRATGDAVMNMAAGDDRHALLKEAIVGWSLQRNGQPHPFTRAALNDFLEKANPKVVDIVEADVRKHNPWLSAEMTVKDIDEQIENLKTLREQALEREGGKATSETR